MVGPWPLAPHHGHYNIYTSYTSSATGSTPGHYKLVGNVYWGESLTVVTCDFPGINTPLRGPSNKTPNI